MIEYREGNLLAAHAQALVNTVNTVGVMGKGIALQFKEAFPENFRAYAEACKRGEVTVGTMFVTETQRLGDPRWVINFPTKKDWRHPSKLEYVESGLQDLIRVIRERRIESVALPPLGCGHGGLDWALVRSLIVAATDDIPGVRVEVYIPTAVYQASPKRQGVEELTLARAMMVDIIRRYSVLGFECTNLEVQKLAYFMQRIIDGLKLENPFKLNFKPNQYGPYADALRHMLDALDGSYLHCQRRLHDAGPLDPIQLDLGRLNRVQEYLSQGFLKEYRGALKQLDDLIDGFQSPFLMELLATVDWLAARDCEADSPDKISSAMIRWPGGKNAGSRKVRLFDPKTIELAMRRLADHSRVLYA